MQIEHDKNMISLIKIELNHADVELFKRFRQFQDQFETLLTAGVFEPYLGHMSVFKDGTAKIRIIENHTVKKFQ